jgi:hypothetical protein
MKTVAIAVTVATLTLIALIPLFVVIWHGLAAVRGLLS